jgi:hypothetical protein
MVVNLIRRILWHLLFALFQVTTWVHDVVSRGWNRIVVRPTLRAGVKNLSKIPKHLTFVFLEDVTSAVDIANILLWCSSIGVQRITLLNKRGETYCDESVQTLS